MKTLLPVKGMIPLTNKLYRVNEMNPFVWQVDNTDHVTEMAEPL